MRLRALVGGLLALLGALPATAVAFDCTTVSASVDAVLSQRVASPFFDEQISSGTWPSGGRLAVVHLPAAGGGATTARRLFLYVLPNGNTIEQTMGCAAAPGLHWRHQIQQIAAQARHLVHLTPGLQLTVAYAEADRMSWPAWRTSRADGDRIIACAADALLTATLGAGGRLELAAHSGGGSFLFGYVNAYDELPPHLASLIWMDANYGYSDERGHGDKIVRWLRTVEGARLVVMAYDDREIELDGKKVVSPTGGTYRRTQDMVRRLERDIPLTVTDDGQTSAWRGLDGRIDIRVHHNPANKILHTVLVERNGFVHSALTGTGQESSSPGFYSDAVYGAYIQPRPFTPEDFVPAR